MPRRFPIGLVKDFADGSSTEVVVHNRIVAVFRVDGKFHAIDGNCPHSGGPLAKGDLVGCIVTCPWHGWQFNVKTGANCLNPRITAESFPVHVEGDVLHVELP